MRIFGIQQNDSFYEFVKKSFQMDHEEEILENWLASNPDGILEDGRILIIGRQVHTNNGAFIDLLGLDCEGNVVVMELKRDRTPRDTIAQSLEYASFVETLDSYNLENIFRSYRKNESLNLEECYRGYFKLNMDEPLSFNKDQRIVVIGQQITPTIRQTALFLRKKGIKVTCVEFTFFQTDEGDRLLSQEIVVGEEQGKPARSSIETTTTDDFFASVDENGKDFFSRIFEWAKQNSAPVNWTTKGFTLNVDINGTLVTLGYGNPPDSFYKQSFNIGLFESSVIGKTAIPEQDIQDLRHQAEATRLFVPTKKNYKIIIDKKLTDAEIDSLLRWFETVENVIRKHGLSNKGNLM